MQPDLSGLKDIHIPDPISTFWPIAPGWWILLGLLIATPIIVYVFRRYQLRSAKHYALTQLDSLANSATKDAAHFAEEVSKLLRRIAILKYGKDKVSSLSAMDWIKFLNKDGYFNLSTKVANLFAYSPYAKGQAFDKYAATEIKQTAVNWINKNT